MTIRASLVQMGPHKIDYANFDWDQVDQNPLFCADAKARSAGPIIWTGCARTAIRWAR